MHVRFVSSHAARPFVGDALTIDITIEDPVAQHTSYDRVSFSVPPDYHAHNDLVAAALLTLIGRSATTVCFNFPISARCAEALRAYYRLQEVGPVDASLEPRRPGRYLGLNFSGGTDSTAVWLLLTRIGVEFKVITSDYGAHYQRERLGYGRLRRDITCATDFRVKDYQRHLGRFNSAVPLLFADYLDLAAIATGHNLFQNPLSIEAVVPGRPPAFRQLDAVVTAGGLEEAHLIRGLTMVGTLTILLTAGPRHAEHAFAASSRPGSWKYFSKAMLARWICAKRGLPLPAFLSELRLPTEERGRDDDLGWGMVAAVLAQRGEIEFPPELAGELEQYDAALGRMFTLDWFSKYNPDYAALIPAELRGPLLDQFHELGLYPYGEADWREVALARKLICSYPFTDNDIMPEMCAGG